MAVLFDSCGSGGKAYSSADDLEGANSRETKGNSFSRESAVCEEYRGVVEMAKVGV
jgi:hypothetical protein